jgi:hypothetical protein
MEIEEGYKKFMYDLAIKGKNDIMVCRRYM